VVVSIIQAWLPLTVLYIGRFLIGVIVGMIFLLGPIITNQCIPTKFAGTLGSGYSVFIGLGFLVSTSVSSDISEKYWFLFINICSVTEIVRVVIMLFVVRVESPFYVFKEVLKSVKKEANLKSIKNKQEIVVSIKDKSKMDQMELLKDRIKVKFLNHPKTNKLVSSFYKAEDLGIQKNYLFSTIYEFEKTKQNLGNPIKTAFSKDFRKPFLICCFLNFSTQGSGIAITSFYAKQVFISLGLQNVDFLVFLQSKNN
jgi:MFS family permease